jgi:hypothetical protein
VVGAVSVYRPFFVHFSLFVNRQKYLSFVFFFQKTVRFSKQNSSHLMLISPTFYARLFCAKVLRFLCLHFRFELAQEYWRKCAHKMLVKLTIDHLKRIQSFSTTSEVLEKSLKLRVC